MSYICQTLVGKLSDSSQTVWYSCKWVYRHCTEGWIGFTFYYRSDCMEGFMAALNYNTSHCITLTDYNTSETEIKLVQNIDID